MAVSIGPKSMGTRVMDPDYPYEEGLEFGTTKQTGTPDLEAEQDTSQPYY